MDWGNYGGVEIYGYVDLDGCAAAVAAYAGDDGCRGDYFFWEYEGKCNCPTDDCRLDYENYNAGGDGQLYRLDCGSGNRYNKDNNDDLSNNGLIIAAIVMSTLTFCTVVGYIYYDTYIKANKHHSTRVAVNYHADTNTNTNAYTNAYTNSNANISTNTSTNTNAHAHANTNANTDANAMLQLVQSNPPPTSIDYNNNDVNDITIPTINNTISTSVDIDTTNASAPPISGMSDQMSNSSPIDQANQADLVVKNYSSDSDADQANQANQADQDESQEASDAFCGSCGSNVKPSQKFCVKCGFRLHRPPPGLDS